MRNDDDDAWDDSDFSTSSYDDADDESYGYDDDANDDSDEPTLACPNCGCEMLEVSIQCPSCGHYPSKEDAQPSERPWWVTVVVVLCVIAMVLGFVVG
jgi:hypothetical protein